MWILLLILQHWNQPIECIERENPTFFSVLFVFYDNSICEFTTCVCMFVFVLYCESKAMQKEMIEQKKRKKKQRYTVCRSDFSFLLFIFLCVVYGFNRACDCIRVQHTFNIFYPQLIFFCWAHTFNQSGKKDIFSCFTDLNNIIFFLRSSFVKNWIAIIHKYLYSRYFGSGNRNSGDINKMKTKLLRKIL